MDCELLLYQSVTDDASLFRHSPFLHSAGAVLSMIAMDIVVLDYTEAN